MNGPIQIGGFETRSLQESAVSRAGWGQREPQPNQRDTILTPRAFAETKRPGASRDWNAKRLYDVFFSLCGLVLLSPVLLVVAALVKLADGGDIFYRQVRLGRAGREFRILKFRTMVASAEKAGPPVTRKGDSRITPIGRLLRKTKLDELPQLWNVLKGDMSLVGPRPEVPRYVRHYTPEQRVILQHRPGITDLASICFRNEEALLANAENVEAFYLQHCLPRKLRLNQEYAEHASLWSDTWIILQTVCPYWIGVLACYGGILAAALWLSEELVRGLAGRRLPVAGLGFARELGVVLAFQLAVLVWRRHCRGLLSYLSLSELEKLGGALGLAAAGLLGWSFLGEAGPTPQVVLVNACVSFSLLWGFRVLLCRWRERSAGEPEDTGGTPARVGIIGAGSTGAQLVEQLNGSRRCGRLAVAFFDDDSHKWQRSIHGVTVAGMPECLLNGWADKLDEVVIAMAGAPAERVQEVEQLARRTSLRVYRVSGLADLWEHQEAA